MGIEPRYTARSEIEDFIKLILEPYPDWEYHASEFEVLIDTPDQAFAEYVVHPTAAAAGRRINHLLLIANLR